MNSQVCIRPPRLYMVEFLRLFFLFFIILGHCYDGAANLIPKEKIYHLFHTTSMITAMGVEFFFIIGGFFLYKNLGNTASSLIKKTYVRLLPALLFVFLSTVILTDVAFKYWPNIIFLSTGLSLSPSRVTGWGDWYVGVYFWTTCLYIALFQTPKSRAFTITGILVYLSLMLLTHAHVSSWLDPYYTVIGKNLTRGLSCMGLGIIISYLSEHIQFTTNKIISFLFTLLEGYCLVQVFNYIARTSHSHLNFLSIELIFICLLFSIASSYGYISRFFNRMSWITAASRYTYSIFLCHIIFMRYLEKHPTPNDYINVTVVFVGSILLGMFEYHFIEQKAVPVIKKFFRRREA